MAKSGKIAGIKTRLDSFVNAITGIGDSTRDKRLGGTTTVPNLTQQQLEDLYRGDDLGAVIAEKLPEEMLRKGFEVAVEGDRELTEELSGSFEDLEAPKHLKEAITWGRVYGGGAVLIGADDGQADLSKPLDLKRIKTIKFLTAFQRYELMPRTYYGDPMAPKYGLPETFYLMPFYVGANTPAKAANIIVHESRFIIFDGVPVTRRQRIANAGWGDSVYIRVHEVLRDYGLTWGAVANLMSDWNQGIFKIQGLRELILGNDDDVVTKRLQLLDVSRSVARGVVLDAGDGETPAEDFHREAAPLTGIPEILEQFSLRLAAAARMPVALLMGQAPGGLNATGKADQEFYADQIAAKQNEILLPALNYLAKVVFAAKDGPTGGKEPENWSIKFHPLKQLSELEESQRRLAIAQADQIYLAAQVVTPEEVAASRFGGDDFNGGTLTVDMAARAAMNVSVEDRLAPKPDPAETAAADPNKKPDPSK